MANLNTFFDVIANNTKRIRIWLKKKSIEIMQGCTLKRIMLYQIKFGLLCKLSNYHSYVFISRQYSLPPRCVLIKAAFPRAKFLCHISHALQSLLTYFCGIITVNLYSRTDTDEKWINNSYNFDINDCRACSLWQRKFGRVLEP